MGSRSRRRSAAPTARRFDGYHLLLWGDRFTVVVKWLIVTVFLGVALGVALWIPIDAVDLHNLRTHGVTVQATVEDTAAGGQVLLRFPWGGVDDEQWTSNLTSTPAIGSKITVVVDRRDDTAISDPETSHQWGSYVVAGIGVILFAALGIVFIRVPSSDLFRYRF
jgi:hypothetical protein